MPFLKMNILQKDNMLYTTNDVVSFIVFNVSPVDLDIAKKAICNAHELLKKGLLRDKLIVDKKLILVTPMKKKRLLQMILSFKKIPIQATYVYKIEII